VVIEGAEEAASAAASAAAVDYEAAAVAAESAPPWQDSPPVARDERECCFLVLNLVSSTLPCILEHLCVRACVCVFVGTSRNLWEPLGSLWQPL
jgi:hypothetical protein